MEEFACASRERQLARRRVKKSLRTSDLLSYADDVFHGEAIAAQLEHLRPGVEIQGDNNRPREILRSRHAHVRGGARDALEWDFRSAVPEVHKIIALACDVATEAQLTLLKTTGREALVENPAAEDCGGHAGGGELGQPL